MTEDKTKITIGGIPENAHRTEEPKKEESADGLKLDSFCGTPYSEKNGIKPDQVDMTTAEAQNIEEMAINEEAQRIYKSGKALEYMINTCQKMHVGDEIPQAGMILCFADTYVSHSFGLHCNFRGESGSGKTHCAKTVVKILPDKRAHTTMLSDKALFRWDDQGDETMLIIDEQSMSSVFGEIYKQVTDDWNKPAEYQVNEQINGKWVVVPRYTKIRCPFVRIKANYTGDEQTADRELKFDFKSDEKQLLAIRERQIAIALNPAIVNDDHQIRVCKRIWGFLTHEVVNIPYIRDILCKNLERSRVYNQMMELIWSSAVMAAPCRNRNELGQIEASIEDFKIACRILNSKEGAQNDTLGAEAKRLLLFLEKLSSSEYSFTEIRERSGLSPQALTYALHGRNPKNSENAEVGGLCSLDGGFIGTRSEGRGGILQWNRELYEKHRGSGLSLFSMDPDRVLYWEMTENNKKVLINSNLTDI